MGGESPLTNMSVKQHNTMIPEMLQGALDKRQLGGQPTLAQIDNAKMPQAEHRRNSSGLLQQINPA